MKNFNYAAIYESPAIDFLSAESEGILCTSTASGNHVSFTEEMEIIF